MGPISTFGSVVVNGVTYDTSAATFVVNDAAATEAELSVGDVVLVEGTLNADGVTGTASTVTYDDLVTGPVTSISLATDSLVVLGQTIRITADTSFDDAFSPRALDGVAVGTIVEVSGVPDANGDFVATRIEPKPAGTTLEVSGIVANLDSAASTFTLGGLTVDFSAAMLRDFPGGAISDGDLVEAKGPSLSAGNELVAAEVEFESPFPTLNSDDFVEIEGVVTRFVDASDFAVNGLPVTTNAATEFDGGAATDLALNVRLEVEGVADGNGILVADEIEFRGDRDVRISAQIDSVDTSAGTLVVLGITVTTDALTRFEDQSDADIDPLGVADLAAGDYVEVRGDEQPAGSGTVQASGLERDDIETTVELRGAVTAINEPAFTVLGVTINTDTNTEFEDASDDVTAAEFFAALSVGDLVAIKGTEVGATAILAEDAELEIDN